MKSLLSRLFESASVEELDTGPDGNLRLLLTGRFGNARLRATWVGVGWPADVEQALERSHPAQLQSGDLVFIAQKMSPGAIRMLEEREASWADEAGNAHIVTPGVIVIRDTAAAEQFSPLPAVSWSPSALAVGEALLARTWSEGIGTTELANLVQWSPGRVSSVLQGFDAEGWTVKYGPQRGSTAVRELSDSSGLLDSWAAAIVGEERDLRMAHRTMRAPLNFLEEELAGALDEEVRWALSGWAAANELAPMAGAVPSLQIYVHEDDFEQPLDRALEGAGLEHVTEGGRVTFFRAQPSVLALSEPQPSMPGLIVSPPRVYADLLAMGGRGEDAALHLREEALPQSRRPEGRQSPPLGLTTWERGCRERLDRLAADKPELAAAYSQGTWSASYRLTGTRETPTASRFLSILREVVGHETGWPVWRIPDSGRNAPRPVDSVVECWSSDTVFADAAHADFWRADPHGRLCLIRGYQEDSAAEPIATAPGAWLDLTLPIWRTGECLLHAGRLARRLEATAVQMMMHWDGLEGRQLCAIASPRRRAMHPTRPAVQDQVISFTELSPTEIDSDLPAAVRQLVEPLFSIFDFFEPPADIYAEELATMRAEDA